MFRIPTDLREELKKGLHGLNALHELEMLVANLMSVQYMPNRPAIDSQVSKDRPVDCDRLVYPDQAFMSLCKFSFLVEFFIGFEFFLPT